MSMVTEQVQAGCAVAHLDSDVEGWRRRVALLEDENATLRKRGQRLEREQQQFRERIGELEAERTRLQAERDRLEEANARLRERVEALRRAAKRQAAPFSRNDPAANPKRCGRKPGAAHGRHGHRQPPGSGQVDRVVVVGLATDYCVRASAIDACREGFEVTVATDAIRAVEVERGDGERALEEMRAAGAELTTSEDVLRSRGD